MIRKNVTRHNNETRLRTPTIVLSVLVHDENDKTMFVSVQEFEELDNLDAVTISSRLRQRQKTITAKQIPLPWQRVEELSICYMNLVL